MRYISQQANLESMNDWYENVVGYKPSDERPELTRDELGAEILEYVAAVYEDKGVDSVPVVTLKGVKHNERLSEETHCFTASVYLDGVKVGEVGNRGHGGEDEWNAPRPRAGWKTGNDSGKADRAMWALLHDAAWRFKLFGEDKPCSWDENEKMRESLDIVIGDKVNDFLTARDMKRALGRKMIFKKKDVDGLFEIAIGKKGDLHRNGLFDKYEAAADIEAVLNRLPIDKALEYWRAA